jgi:hypothetical protein
MPEPEEKQQQAESIGRAITKLLTDLRPKPVNLGKPEFPAEANAAVAHCREAWQEAFTSYMSVNYAREGSLAESFAAREAAAAYRAAMPPLRDYDDITDFIACVAHGILIDAVPQERAGQLLYAAQVALSALARNPHP